MASQYQTPEWEQPAAVSQKHVLSSTMRKPSRPLDGSMRGSRRTMVGSYLDRLLPAHRTYFGRSRRTFLIVVGVAILALLALIIGLAAGLSTRPKAQDLPFPFDRQTFDGDLTYYGPALGACGVTSLDTDDIVSVSHVLFDASQTGSNPNANPLCGLRIRAARYDDQAGGRRSLDLTVVDRCVGCQPTDLDVSPGAFKKLANPDQGRVNVSWAWLSPPPAPS